MSTFEEALRAMNSHNTLMVSAIQMDSQGDEAKNLSKALKLIDRAADAGAEVVTLPEMFNYIGSKLRYKEIAGRHHDIAVLELAKKCQHHAIWIHCGSMIEKAKDKQGKFYNTSILLDPEGNIAETYRKIHLFDANIGNEAVRESEYIKPGSRVVIARISPFVFGLTICFDLRFPELFADLTFQGANVILVPAAFMALTGKDHWEALLRARAIENQVYIIAPAQIGVKYDQLSYYGHSMIVNPWGTILAEAKKGESVITCELSLAEVKRIQNAVPLKKGGDR